METRCAIAGILFCLALAAPQAAHAAEGDFGSAGEFEVGNTPYDLAVADFDADDDLDIATPNANGSNVSILLNDGDGSFADAPGSPVSTNGSPKGVAAGDLSGDGIPDLVVTEGATDTAYVLHSDGDGTFTGAGRLLTGPDPDKVELADVDADGGLDVAVVNSAYEAANGSVSVFLRGDDEVYSPANGSPYAVGEFPTRIKAGNLNGDAYADLVVSNRGSDDISILLGAQFGSMTTAATSPEAAGSGADGIAIANFDETAGNDLAIANSFSENTSVLLGAGDGNFSGAESSPEAQGDNDVTAADLNGDDNVDLATYDTPSDVAILSGNGSGDFSPASTSPEAVLGLGAQLDSADLDADGDTDILSAGGNGGYYAVTVLLNDEADADADGFLDIGDDCPDLSGATRGCPFFTRQVTLKYKRRAQAFKGVVTSEEPTCVGPGVTVKIRKSGPRGTKVIAADETDLAGKYLADRKVRQGYFQARIGSTFDPQVGICSEAFSPGIQVKP